MNVHLYEKLWMWASGVIIAVFVASILYTSTAQSLQPPSHVETIDPQTVRASAEFAQPAVVLHADGSATVHVLAMMFAFLPTEIRVPRGRPVTFRMTSPDVIHGFQIVNTNGNAMVVPGYITQFTTQFDTAGEYLIVCNEYSGLGHHGMYASLVVVDGLAADGGQEVAQ